jgi:hypothetical protein
VKQQLFQLGELAYIPGYPATQLIGVQLKNPETSEIDHSITDLTRELVDR